MKRQILTMAAVLALVFAGAVFAQSPQNTTAPGPTTQQEPGLTNNNLPNPGNPVTLNEPAQQEPATTAEPGVAPETEQGEGMDVDVDTGSRAEGAVDLDVTSTTDADTDASGIDETQTDTYTGTAADSDSLPATASELPTMALIGLLALGAAFLVRARRHA
jgi:LPXTG-motif cell wall-anchored protein